MPPTHPDNGRRVVTIDDRPAPSDPVRSVRQIRRAPTPEDVGPRLIAMGATQDASERLTSSYGQDRIANALDALEEYRSAHEVTNPVGWVTAAVVQGWDLSALLTQRREREARLAAVDEGRQERQRARDEYPQRRAVAQRWDAAISAALDDEQLTWAMDAVVSAVPGLGRRSIPVARAELLAWAIDVHQRHPGRPLADALGADLDAGAEPAGLSDAPLPEPPALDQAADAVEPLSTRLGRILEIRPQLASEAPLLEVALTPDGPRFGRDLEL